MTDADKQARLESLLHAARNRARTEPNYNKRQQAIGKRMAYLEAIRIMKGHAPQLVENSGR